jgi:hypothetical protein
MTIGILGWGSLIWSPRDLKIISQKWQKDGVDLPIEFARISSDSRLTLVILQNFKYVKTLWNSSSYNKLDDAIANLKEREGMPQNSNKIGYINLVTKEKNSQFEFILNNIEEWASQKKLDAVIWTDLGSNFEEKTQSELNYDNLNLYLNSLNNDLKPKAIEYIVKAPMQIATQFREKLDIQNLQ